MTARTLFLTAMLLMALTITTWGQDASLLHTHVYLHIRSGPAITFDIVGVARPCETMTVLADAEGWYRIQSAGGEGYVAGWYTHAGAPHCEDESPAQPDADIRYIHTHDYVNIRQGPATTFDAIGVAAPCASIDLMAFADEWYQVQRDGRVGFLARWAAHTGAQHCDTVYSQADTPSASAPEPASAPAPAAASEDGRDTEDNKCFTDWTNCNRSDPDETTFWWNLGWCVASIESGSRAWSPQACMGRLGTPLPADFAIPGYATPTPTPEPASSNDDDDSGGSQCPQGQYPIYVDGVFSSCGTDF